MVSSFESIVTVGTTSIPKHLDMCEGFVGERVSSVFPITLFAEPEKGAAPADGDKAFTMTKPGLYTFVVGSPTLGAHRFSVIAFEPACLEMIRGHSAVEQRLILRSIASHSSMPRDGLAKSLCGHNLAEHGN